jgi:hypothetical protein
MAIEQSNRICPVAAARDGPEWVNCGYSGVSTPTDRCWAVEPAHIGHFETFEQPKSRQ